MPITHTFWLIRIVLSNSFNCSSKLHSRRTVHGTSRHEDLGKPKLITRCGATTANKKLNEIPKHHHFAFAWRKSTPTICGRPRAIKERIAEILLDLRTTLEIVWKKLPPVTFENRRRTHLLIILSGRSPEN